ncbi:MAG: hypothetical protein KGL93_11235 [Gemmatimonadota bacterium]|nr:hypothetical protein [Gemmatimonadota bacterium]
MTSSLVAEMRAIISMVLPAWGDAGLEPLTWAMALHPQVVERCDACGAWGALVPDPACSHPVERRSYIEVIALTTLGGETLPLSSGVLASLLVESMWLMGHVPAIIRRLPVQQPGWPVAAAELLLHVGPTLTATDLESTPIYARLTVDLIRRPIVLLFQRRPDCLPR